jgi:dihydrodipicolinate synthase/N-acetylneuraminate lyase
LQLSLKKEVNAKALQQKYSELIRLLFVEGNPCGVKSILDKKG